MSRTFVTSGGTKNVGMHHALHSLGVWAAEHAHARGIRLRHVMCIFVSHWVGGDMRRREAAIHGAIWSAVSTLGATGISPNSLWLYFRREISYAVDEQNYAALYISCLHGFGHAVGVLSSTTFSESSSFKCLDYPHLDLPSSKWQHAENMALKICVLLNCLDTVNLTQHWHLDQSREGSRSLHMCRRGVYAHVFHTNVQKGALTSKSPTNTDIKINWWAPCGRVLRYAAPCFVFLFRWEIAQDRLMHASGMAREDNFLFPASCYRSASNCSGIAGSLTRMSMSMTWSWLACSGSLVIYFKIMCSTAQVFFWVTAATVAFTAAIKIGLP